jgi:hypothetical protein
MTTEIHPKQVFETDAGEDCSPEDIQYHLYIIEKVRSGLERADNDGVIEQHEAEARLAKWIIE